MSAGVELDHVTVRFGQFTAVDDATLDIKGGEFFSFLGPSGCGKTTILRAIAGLVQPTGGEISVAGRRIDNIPIHKRNIGLVFQKRKLAKEAAEDAGA